MQNSEKQQDFFTIKKRGDTLENTHVEMLVDTKLGDIENEPRLKTISHKRGKRLSLAGPLIRKPHPKVPPRNYHTLLDKDRSAPEQLRQLLIWCFSASAPSKPSDMDNLLSQVSTQIVGGLTDNSISTSWYVQEPHNVSVYYYYLRISSVIIIIIM